MYPTKNDLPADSRNQLAELLNRRLADAIDLALQSKQAHWNVKGTDFFQLHELFDQVAEAVREHVDTIAERAVQLGGIAEGTLQRVVAHTQLPEYEVGTSDHVDRLSTAIAAAGKQMRAAIGRSEELGDANTADLFTEVSRDLDKWLWFVEAHKQG